MATRQRSGSIVQTLNNIDDLHTAVPAPVTVNGSHPNGTHANGKTAPASPPRKRAPKPYDSGSLGLWKDTYTMRWMRVPESSFKLALIPVVLYINWELAARVIDTPIDNPFARLLFISHPIIKDDGSLAYRKGYHDLTFVAYWVICFSFIRLFWTVYVFHPMARWFGIRSEGKIIRFGEQGYAVVYFTAMGALGLLVMSQLPIWYFNCRPQWELYPQQWQMTPALKSYYLLHSAYWLQQFLVLALRLEKPRRDYTELVIHHFVTLWLIGWSYLVNLTWIGNLVYLTMDWSDVFLAAAKMCNYVRAETAAAAVFSIFVVCWTYTRHYLNIYLLYSVWTEFDLLPKFTRSWTPAQGVWMPDWMRFQIWLPIMLLQIVNLFWYFRILRILHRALFQSTLEDERSDDEDEGEDEADAKKDD